MREITAFKLDCGKKFFTKKAAINHERACKCWTNPIHKTCKTCKFGKQEWDSDMEDGSFTHTWKQWTCKNPAFNYDIHFTAAHENASDLCINCPVWQSKNLTTIQEVNSKIK